MWETGTIAVNGKEYKFECKHCEQPSADYGIDGGRIPNSPSLRSWVKPTDTSTITTAGLTWTLRPQSRLRCWNVSRLNSTD